MKTIRTILLFAVIIVFTSISYGEANECNYKSKIQQALCEKMGGMLLLVKPQNLVKK